MIPEPTTRDRLVRAGRDLFLDVGAEGFSLREVARRTKLTPAAVYRHFDGKEALLAAVCVEGFRAFASYLLQCLREEKPKARLLATGDQYLRFALERPMDYRVIFMTAIPTKDRIDRDRPPETFAFLVDRVRECMDAKVLAKADAHEVAVSIWAHVHGLVALRISGHFRHLGDDESFGKVYRRSVRALLEGLGA